MNWNDLTLKEKKIAESIEEIYLHHKTITTREFLKALFFLRSKYEK